MLNKFKIFLIGLSILFITNMGIAQTVRQSPDFEKSQYDKEKLNKVIMYLKLASIELDGMEHNSDVKTQIDNFIKYLSAKNLNGDYFSQYAREKTNMFMSQIKNDFIRQISGSPNQRVIMEKRIEDTLNPNLEYDKYRQKNTQYQKQLNNNINIDDYTNTNKRIINKFNGE
jgi:hypothetical protein